MENIRHYRAMAALCRLQSTLDPENAWLWLARANRWEDLVETEIEDHYRECNANRDSLVA